MEKEKGNSKDELLDKRGEVSKKLSSENFNNESLGEDHIGIEIISVEPKDLYKVIAQLKSYGFNYLQCQGGYDEGPGKRLVSFYHLISSRTSLFLDESRVFSVCFFRYSPVFSEKTKFILCSIVKYL